MSHTVLITGGSGYLGGSLLAQLSSAKLPQYKKLYALVRTKEQEEAVKQYGADPLRLNVDNDDSIFKGIVDAGITVIFFLIDARASKYQLPMIRALAENKKRTGMDVHFLHTTGAKLFSEHAGHSTDHSILDSDPDLYEIQKASQAPHAVMSQVIVNNS
jgi:uncharacterized protein YbjT (DUF2867 family)